MACTSDVTQVVRLRELIEVERDLATAVADLESTNREGAEAARDRTDFLLQATSSLGQSLELETIFQRLVDVIAPGRAAYASVWSEASNGGVRRVVHAPDTEILKAGDRSVGAAELVRGISLPVLQVIASRTTLRVPNCPGWLEARGAAPAARALRGLGIRDSLFLPIGFDQQTVAVLAIALAGENSFDDHEIMVYEAAARQAGLAYANARLFGEASDLRRTAEAATLAKDRFLAHVSHDLRNPLSSILGWAGLLRDTADPAKVRRGLDIIERNAQAQAQLIEDLLDVSRIATGKLTLSLALQDVRAAIEVALDAARLAADAKGVVLDVEIEADVGSVTVDPARFRQIVWNLVSNAVKFTEARGTVTLRARREKNALVVEVADTGRGIAADFLPRVFGSFEQAEAGAQRTGGLGLGLAIVKYLVELHGGTIEVRSEGVGHGACFTAHLPIRAALASGNPKTAPVAAGPLDGLRIVVVDDELDAREIVSILLEDAGASVLSASTADEALELVATTRPDILVSDISMPMKDGKDLLRELRANPDWQGRDTPAVALTALTSRKDRVEILAAGFDAQVTKPVNEDELVLVLARLGNRQRATRGILDPGRSPR